MKFLTFSALYVIFLFPQTDCFINRQYQGEAAKELINQLKSRLIDRRGYEGPHSKNMQILSDIVAKLEDIYNGDDDVTREEVADLAAEVSALTTKIEELSDMTENLERKGTTYVRWGRNDCPGNGSNILYRGYAGGSWYAHSGAAASMLCLHSEPDWRDYDDGKQDTGLIYGAEYNDHQRKDKSPNVNRLYDDDVPCVVCDVQRRSSMIMIPGKSICPAGYTAEYWGYLMAGRHDHASASNYYCVDADPEAEPDSKANTNGYLLYYVEGRCGSLPCPPYVENRELTCVVCTK